MNAIAHKELANAARCLETGPVTRLDAILAERTPKRQIATLCDTRAMHRYLARLTGKRPVKGPAGRYREPGEPVYVIVNARADCPMTYTTCPAERVASEMAMLAERIHDLLWNPPDPNARHSELVAILATFFRIHPYVDGNGRIARILFRRASELLKLPLNDRWTMEVSAYGAALSLAIECYPLSPKPLEAYLKRFFDVSA